MVYNTVFILSGGCCRALNSYLKTHITLKVNNTAEMQKSTNMPVCL